MSLIIKCSKHQTGALQHVAEAQKDEIKFGLVCNQKHKGQLLEMIPKRVQFVTCYNKKAEKTLISP